MNPWPRAPLPVAVAAAYGVLLAAITLSPRSVDGGWELTHWSAVRGVAKLLTLEPGQVVATADVASNVLFFVPIGVFIALRWRRADLATTVLVASALSLVIEVAQWLAPTDRTASALDFVANVAGAVLGFAAVRAVKHHPRAGSVVLGGLVVIALGVAALTVWGLAVSTA